MNRKEFNCLVMKYEGWIENDVVRFPTPYQKDMFTKEWFEICARNCSFSQINS